MAVEGLAVGLASGQATWLIAAVALRPRQAHQVALSVAGAGAGAAVHACLPWLWPVGALLVAGCAAAREWRRHEPRSPAPRSPPRSPTFIVF